jgi:selenocysteine-specific translation elongation factor
MNMIVAVPVDESLASFIGKKGSANGITFYNRKIGSDVIVVLFPSQEDEKVYSLAEAILVASQVVLSTSNPGKRFGEALVACSLLDKKVLLTDDTDVSRIMAESGITNYTTVRKEELIDKIKAGSTDSDSRVSVRVDVDKAFPVKGVGTVALGVVTRGVLKQHDRLYHSSSGKQVLVRSIQCQDEDVTEAQRGSRVGVSLKDIDDDEISKGDVLTQNLVNKTERIIAGYRVSKLAKGTVDEGASYGIVLNFSYTNCTVKRSEDSRLELELKSKLPVEIGDELFLIRNEAPRIFAAGKVTEILG